MTVRVCLNKSVLVYELLGKTVFVDTEKERKLICQGSLLPVIKELEGLGEVLYSHGRYLYGEIDVTLLVERGILITPGSTSDLPHSPSPEIGSTPKDPGATENKLFGIDFLPSELDGAQGIVEVGCFVGRVPDVVAEERLFFDMLRQCSDSRYLFYRMLVEGIWDQYLNRTILEGVVLSDMGVHPVEDAPRLLSPANFSLSLCRDHKGTVEFLKKYDKSFKHGEKINLLVFDGHFDHAHLSYRDKAETEITSHNFLWHLEGRSLINCIYVIGLRGMRLQVGPLPSSIKLITYGELSRSENPAWPFDKEHPYHFSFDLDFLDSTCIRNLAHPAPGGPTIVEAMKLFETLCQSLTVVGLDIVEFRGSLTDKRATKMDANVVKDLILSFLGSIVLNDKRSFFSKARSLR